MESDIKNLPFTPSPFCKKDYPPHRRVAVCSPLIGNKKFREVGRCKECGGEQYFPHIDLAQYGNLIQPSHQRDFVLFKDQDEFRLRYKRYLAGEI